MPDTLPDPGPFTRDAVTFDQFREEIAEYLELVGISEIAELAGVQPNTVKVWRQRHDDFPKPVAQLKMGPVWTWEQVRPWVERQLAKKPGPQTA